jgi:hypothetical protein
MQRRDYLGPAFDKETETQRLLDEPPPPGSVMDLTGGGPGPAPKPKPGVPAA